jgi:glycosyltransferase involved in cell wall biosynthesis
MKILFINGLHPKPDNYMGGIFITNRLKVLKKYNIEYYSISPIMKDSRDLIFIRKMLKKPQNIIYPSKIIVENVEYNFLNINTSIITRLFYSFPKYAAKIILKNVNINNFDLIHAHWVYPHGYIAKIISEKYNIPYVVTAHGSDIHKVLKEDYIKRSAIIDTLENSSKCIFVSNGLLIEAKKFGYSGNNSSIIPNGYDPEIFYQINKEDIRKEIGIYNNRYKYVGFVGNLIPIKRADKLSKIFHFIDNEIKNTKFIVVGDGYLRKEIENNTKDLDIIFTGILPQKDVAKYMNAMDVMILPSRNEGWPCVILEAQACGTVVVGSSNGGIPEAIGFNEYVVEEGENFEERFAEKTVEYLIKGYDKNKLLERAKEYTWGKIVEKEIEIYKELI